MHGLIFETSVWLLAESTRLLSVPRQSAFHWLPTWDSSPECLWKGPAHTECMQVPPSASGISPVRKVSSVKLHTSKSAQQSLLVLFPRKKIEASTMRGPSRLAEVFSGTPRKADRSHDLFILDTVTGNHPGIYMPGQNQRRLSVI